VSEGRAAPAQPSPSQASSPPPRLQAELLTLAAETAAEAGQLLAERFEQGSEQALGTKSSPTDLVSQADLDAERLIVERLHAERPQDGLMGEEGSRQQGSSGVDWVVDPLDGTVNFLLGIPQWCVSIAARDDLGTLAGAVYDPIREEMFCATRDGPATLALMAEPSAMTEVRERSDATGASESRILRPPERAGDLASAMVATGLAYGAEVRAAQAQVLARLIPKVRDIRRFGSAALDLAWTAAGRYDAYFERSVKQWDVEAGWLICQRSGLRVVELPADGVLPWGVLATTSSLIGPLREIVGRQA
jgi:myo-inositol-1(or 4)-monophosphatase